jgi:hypothetical protein
MKDMGIRLDQNKRYKSSLENPDDPVYQIGQSGFHRENLCLKVFQK